MTMTATAKARHAAATRTKRQFVGALVTLFPTRGQHHAEALFRDLRAEATVEEIADVARPLEVLARRVATARENRS